MSMTADQLQEWVALPDHQMTLRRLAELGISVLQIAEAELDGYAPPHASDVIALPVVQQAIDRLSRARLAAAMDALRASVEALPGQLENLLTELAVRGFFRA